MQVEDVDQKFAELAKVEANGWKEIELLPKPVGIFSVFFYSDV